MLAHSQEAAKVHRSIMDLILQAYLAELGRQSISEEFRCLSLVVQVDFMLLIREKLVMIIFVFIFPYRGLLYFALGFQTVDMGSDELPNQHRSECLLTFYLIHFHYLSFLL